MKGKENIMARKITVICDDDVEVMSITTRSSNVNNVKGVKWAIGIFEVRGKNQVCMPEIKVENKIN